jgi:N-hydroxyarylamine O-acetyltransferase
MIEAYLDRLGIQRPPGVDEDALAILQAAHQRAIPFENIDVWSGVPLDLDPDALFDKIVRRNRGGFCYELNSLFAELLTGLGFDVRMMSAGVVNAEGVIGPPFDHMCLRVELENGPWLTDVGFGRAPLVPLRLEAADRIEDPAAVFRLRRADAQTNDFGTDAWDFAREAHAHSRSAPDGWMPLYRFDPADRRIEEFAPMCSWHQSSADSVFPRTLILSRATTHGRVSVRGMDWIRETNRGREEGVFTTPDERKSFIHNEFRISLPGKPAG